MTPPVDPGTRDDRAPFAFAHGALDRRADWRRDDARLDALWHDAATRVVVQRHDGRVLADLDAGILATLSPAALGAARARANFLGEIAGTGCFACVLSDDEADALAPAPGAFTDLRTVAGALAAHEAGLAAYARALSHWQSRKRYCGRCGAPTVFSEAGHRATCSDPACAQQYFPRTDPAIIVIVTDGDRCLLGNQAAWGNRRFSTLAGFVEPGETLEQAVAREVHEEAGVHVARCRYVASQPWPFPASLMVGFEAEATSRDIVLGDELADARWFDAAEMPGQVERGELVLSPAISIAYHLISGWYARVAGGTLPPGPLMHARR